MRRPVYNAKKRHDGDGMKVFIWVDGKGLAALPESELGNGLLAVGADEKKDTIMTTGPAHMPDVLHAGRQSMRTRASAFVALCRDEPGLDEMLDEMRLVGMMAWRLQPGKLEAQREADELTGAVAGKVDGSQRGRTGTGRRV